MRRRLKRLLCRHADRAPSLPMGYKCVCLGCGRTWDRQP